MNKLNIVRSAFGFTALLFSVLYTTTAAAYIFGPPPVTELAESGENMDNISLFKREESYVNANGGTPVKFESIGLAGVIKKGDRTGSTNFMYRLSKEKAPAFSSYDSTDFGVGVGGEWNLLSDRSLGLIGNLQFDFGSASEKPTTTTYYYSAYTFGVEVGALYRLFIDKATVAPFIMLNQYGSTIHNTASSSAFREYYTYINGSSVNLGVSVIVGKFTLTYTQTNSEYKYSFDIYSGTGKEKTSGNMITIGFNY